MKKQPPTKREPASKTGPREPPSVKLPGGVTVRGYAFQITAVDSHGRPTTFELARGNVDSDCVLWASPSFVDSPLPGALRSRMQRRIEESIEGPGSYDTQARTYTKERSLGPSVINLPPQSALTEKLRAGERTLLLVNDKQTMVEVVGRTADGMVQLKVDDPKLVELMKQGTTPISIEGRVAEEPMLCCARFSYGDGTHDLSCKVAQEKLAAAMAHPSSAMVPWPADQPPQYNGREPCDMWTGPCCCGATHTEGK